MALKILKFIGLLAGMAIVNYHVPFGTLISTIVVFIALWKLIND